MSIYSIVSQLHAGTIVSIIVIILSLVEVTPIKLSPLKWIGNRINHDMDERLSNVEKSILEVKLDLDDHIAQSYRNKILQYFDDVVNWNLKKTLEQWKEIMKACAAYEDYVEKNHLINGDAVEAIDYLKSEYQRCCRERDFLNVIGK